MVKKRRHSSSRSHPARFLTVNAGAAYAVLCGATLLAFLVASLAFGVNERREIDELRRELIEVRAQRDDTDLSWPRLVRHVGGRLSQGLRAQGSVGRRGGRQAPVRLDLGLESARAAYADMAAAEEVDDDAGPSHTAAGTEEAAKLPQGGATGTAIVGRTGDRALADDSERASASAATTGGGAASAAKPDSSSPGVGPEISAIAAGRDGARAPVGSAQVLHRRAATLGRPGLEPNRSASDQAIGVRELSEDAPAAAESPATSMVDVRAPLPAAAGSDAGTKVVAREASEADLAAGAGSGDAGDTVAAAQAADSASSVRAVGERRKKRKKKGKKKKGRPHEASEAGGGVATEGGVAPADSPAGGTAWTQVKEAAVGGGASVGDAAFVGVAGAGAIVAGDDPARTEAAIRDGLARGAAARHAGRKAGGSSAPDPKTVLEQAGQLTSSEAGDVWGTSGAPVGSASVSGVARGPRIDNSASLPEHDLAGRSPATVSYMGEPVSGHTARAAAADATVGEGEKGKLLSGSSWWGLRFRRGEHDGASGLGVADVGSPDPWLDGVRRVGADTSFRREEWEAGGRDELSTFAHAGAAQVGAASTLDPRSAADRTGSDSTLDLRSATTQSGDTSTLDPRSANDQTGSDSALDPRSAADQSDVVSTLDPRSAADQTVSDSSLDPRSAADQSGEASTLDHRSAAGQLTADVRSGLISAEPEEMLVTNHVPISRNGSAALASLSSRNSSEWLDGSVSEQHHSGEPASLQADPKSSPVEPSAVEAERARAEATAYEAEMVRTKAAIVEAERSRGAAAVEAERTRVAVAASKTERARADAIAAEAERARADAIAAEAERARADAITAEAERARADAIAAEAERARADAIAAEAEKARADAAAAAEAERLQAETARAAAEEAVKRMAEAAREVEAEMAAEAEEATTGASEDTGVTATEAVEDEASATAVGGSEGVASGVGEEEAQVSNESTGASVGEVTTAKATAAEGTKTEEAATAGVAAEGGSTTDAATEATTAARAATEATKTTGSEAGKEAAVREEGEAGETPMKRLGTPTTPLSLPPPGLLQFPPEGSGIPGLVEEGAEKYHVLVTAGEGVYAQWQCQVAYYWYLRVKEAYPRSALGGWTRLLHNGREDELMSELPTVVVAGLPEPLEELAADYPVLHRPYGVVEWVRIYGKTLKEAFVLMLEPDHLLLLPPPLSWVSARRPAARRFDYIAPWDYGPLIQRLGLNPASVPLDAFDPIGSSPVLISVVQLGELAPRWLNVSLTLKRDPEAVEAFGWVLEMYAYSIASATVNGGPIRHLLREDFMGEPPWSLSLAVEAQGEDPARRGRVGTASGGDRAATEGESGEAASESLLRVLHYTFGLDYTLSGEVTPGKIGEWHFDKRDYSASYPPRRLQPPPDRGRNALASRLIASINEASENIRGWDERVDPSLRGEGAPVAVVA